MRTKRLVNRKVNYKTSGNCNRTDELNKAEQERTAGEKNQNMGKYLGKDFVIFLYYVMRIFLLFRKKNNGSQFIQVRY